LRFAAVFLLGLVLGSLMLVPASAADITISFDRQTLQARMHLAVHQNMTQFGNESVTVDAAQDPALAAAFTEALKEADSHAGYSALTTTVWSNATWLNLTVAMTLTGASDKRGDIAAVNTTFRAFNVSANLRVGNFSYNTLGKEYFRPVADFYVNASKFENDPNATIRAITFFVNETQSVPGPDAANYVGNFTVLDFRALNVPLDEWQRTFDLGNNTTTWTYTPPVQLGAEIRASELNQSLTLFANYAYSAEVVVPGLAQAEGNIVRVDVGSGQKEWIMVAVVVVLLALAVVVQFMYRVKRKAAKLGRR